MRAEILRMQFSNLSISTSLRDTPVVLSRLTIAKRATRSGGLEYTEN